MRSIGLLAVVTGMLVLASACSSGAGTPPPDNTAPVANFDMPPCTINVACNFASTSTDDAAVTGWNWDFDGDGNPDATTANGAFTYTAAGTFNVSLTVRDAQGLSDTKTGTTTIAPAPPGNPPPGNTPPTASFTHSCTAAACTFISTSTDAAPGSIVTYAWSFGDGGTATAASPTHSYTVTAATEFTVTLTVTDNDGATAVATQTVAVDPAPVTQAPVARFTYSCIAATATCTFENVSLQHGVRIARNAWTFGDGGTSTEKNPTHSYTVTAATEFTVTLTVTNILGATDVTSQKFILDPTAANIPPTAAFHSWCYGVDCIFYSTSTDVAPGGIASYVWDFGDGGTGASSQPVHTYSVSGRSSFMVTLTVTDNEGATRIATGTVTVTPLPPAVQGCTTSGTTVECVLDMTARSSLRLKLLTIHCDIGRYALSKISTPPPVGDQTFLSVCARPVGQDFGVYGGPLDELWVYQSGTQAKIWFTQGAPRANEPPRGPPAGQLTGTFPDWTLSFDDGDNLGTPGQPDFTDLVVGVHATVQ
jgi:PKD repeat protein